MVQNKKILECIQISICLATNLNNPRQSQTNPPNELAHSPSSCRNLEPRSEKPEQRIFSLEKPKPNKSMRIDHKPYNQAHKRKPILSNENTNKHINAPIHQ